MNHSMSPAFHRPVNAAALKLRDYYTIIKKPMDLGSILTQCLLGEYDTFHELIADLERVFNNAMCYNPKGHVIHSMASDLWDYTQTQLTVLAKYWSSCGVHTSSTISNTTDVKYTSFEHLSMRLSTVLSVPPKCPSSDQSASDSVCSKFADAGKLESTSSIDNGGKIEGSSDDTATIAERSKHLFGGPEGIEKLMVGDDVWLLDKRHAHKDALKKKKHGKKKVLEASSDESNSKRCESWLSDEVLATVRRFRNNSFVCHLRPNAQMSNFEKEKERDFSLYIEGFDLKSDSAPTRETGDSGIKPGVTDTRHGLVSTCSSQ